MVDLTWNLTRSKTKLRDDFIIHKPYELNLMVNKIPFEIFMIAK